MTARATPSVRGWLLLPAAAWLGAALLIRLGAGMAFAAQRFLIAAALVLSTAVALTLRGEHAPGRSGVLFWGLLAAHQGLTGTAAASGVALALAGLSFLDRGRLSVWLHASAALVLVVLGALDTGAAPAAGALEARLADIALLALLLVTFVQLVIVQRARQLSAGSALGRTLGRGSLLRTALSGVVATLADFVVVLLLVEGQWLSPPPATLVGCAVGAVVNFSINRSWAFGVGGAYAPQALRYLLVTTTSALFNAGLVWVGLWVHTDYQLVWVLARALVFVTWNHPLNRDYVFATSAPGAARGAVR